MPVSLRYAMLFDSARYYVLARYMTCLMLLIINTSVVVVRLLLWIIFAYADAR